MSEDDASDDESAMNENTRHIVDPKAQTAVVSQAPFETRVMFEDDESHLPEAQVTPLTEEELAERARAEEDLRRRRDVARLEEEQKILDSKKPTVISNPTWSTIPNETTKTYDFSAVQLVDGMNESDEMNDDDDELLSPPSAVAAVVPSADVAPPPPPIEPEVDDQPLVIEEPQQIIGPDQTFRSLAEPQPIPVAAPVQPAQPVRQAPAAQPKRRPAKKRESGFADWIHTYRLPIITFLIGVVVGVFIAFLF